MSTLPFDAGTASGHSPQGTRPEAASGWWRDPLAGLSLANLAFLRVWVESLTYTATDAYTMESPPLPVGYVATMACVLLLGLLLWPVLRLARTGTGALRRAAQVMVLLAVLLPLNAIRGALAGVYPYLRGPLLRVLGEVGLVLVGAVLLLLFLAAVWRWPGRLFAASFQGLLTLSPFVLLTFGQGLAAARRPSPATFTTPATTMLHPQGVAERRVVWVIFDELDYRLAFVDRPAGLRLPEFDRLARESLTASQARSPSRDTMTSLPSLISGSLWEHARPQDARTLMVQATHQSKPVSWGEQPTIFSRARAAGLDAALIGWYHPYCRVLPAGLSRCWWTPMPMQHNSMGIALPEQMRNQFRSLVESNLYSPFGQSLTLERRARDHRLFLEQAREVARDGRFALTLLHVPLPHGPHFYDHSKGTFTLANSPIHGYVDSLALADQVLGQVRRDMEAAGLADRTTLVATADHAYRSSRALDGKADPRVPFLLHLPGQTRSLAYGRRFNTALTANLLLSILSGEVATPEDAARQIDRAAK